MTGIYQHSTTQEDQRETVGSDASEYHICIITRRKKRSQGQRA